MEIHRESMDYDVVIVGAGPAGLATSIKLKQTNPDLNICILAVSYTHLTLPTILRV